MVENLDTTAARKASADRLESVKVEIGSMLGKDVSHSTVTRLAAIVAREIGATHDSYTAYADFLADKANGYAFEACS